MITPWSQHPVAIFPKSMSICCLKETLNKKSAFLHCREHNSDGSETRDLRENDYKFWRICVSPTSLTEMTASSLGRTTVVITDQPRSLDCRRQGRKELLFHFTERLSTAVMITAAVNMKVNRLKQEKCLKWRKRQLPCSELPCLTPSCRLSSYKNNKQREHFMILITNQEQNNSGFVENTVTGEINMKKRSLGANESQLTRLSNSSRRLRLQR